MPIELNIIHFLKNRLAGAPMRLQLWDGRKIDLTTHPRVILTIPKPTSLRYLFYPSLYTVGSGYVEDELQIDGTPNDIRLLMDSLISMSSKAAQSPITGTVLRSLSRLERLNPLTHNPLTRRRATSTRAIRYHFDVSDDFFKLWLDRNMVYSAGYFENGDETIDAAQEKKLDYVCRKLMLSSGDKFLDIGCGWGALIRWAVENYDVKATGITISRNQYEYVSSMIRKDKLEKRCKVLLCDYQDLHGQSGFDKIASIGMVDHVPISEYSRFFKTIHDLLRPGGLFLNQGISITDEREGLADPTGARRFMSQYVFPEGDLATLATIEREMNEQGLEAADIESLRPHYSRTLLSWANRLEHHSEEARVLAGERRYRIWRAYLNGSAVAFERGWMSVYQTLSFRKTTRGSWPLPLTRDHLYTRKIAAVKPPEETEKAA